MAKKRIKKPVRRKKESDYPGEMSFRKALGLNPVVMQGGGTYNMQKALELGYTPDETGHWPSVDSTNGMWLKSKQHPTAWMEYMQGYALNPENNRRFDVVPNVEGYFGDNQLQYVDKKQTGGELQKAQYEEKKKSDVLDLENSLDFLVDTRGGTRDFWGRTADTIGYHESAGTMDPGQLQHGGGPGRGIFQFENDSLETAQNRYKIVANKLKLKPDPEILKAKSATELSPRQQYVLFLINLSQSRAVLKDYAEGRLSLEDLWLQGHKNVEVPGNRKSFRTSVQKAKDKSIQEGYDSFKELGGRIKLQRGGRPTMYVDPNDPAGMERYQAYADSLDLHNKSLIYKNAVIDAVNKSGHLRHINVEYPQSNTNNPTWESYENKGNRATYPFFKKPAQKVIIKSTKEYENAKKQELLKEAGLYTGKIDGIWGPNSQAAWETYQSSTNQKPTSSDYEPQQFTVPTPTMIGTKDGTRWSVIEDGKEIIYTDRDFYNKYGTTPEYAVKSNYLKGKNKKERGGSLTTPTSASFLNRDRMRRGAVDEPSVFEDVMAGLYGVGEGLLDAATKGATDELTDMGFKALQGAAGTTGEAAQQQQGYAGVGNAVGAIGGAALGIASPEQAVTQSVKGAGKAVSGFSGSPEGDAVGQAIQQIPGLMGNFKDMKTFMASRGGRFRYQQGGQMLNQNLGLTEIGGPSHAEGGVTLPNNGQGPDVEVEGPETIYTPENYVMSEKIKASKTALREAGISEKYAGKSYADISKAIKKQGGDKLRPNDKLTLNFIDSEMKKLIKAHNIDRQLEEQKNVVAASPEEQQAGYNMYPDANSIAFPGSGPTQVVPTNNNDPIMVTGADGSQQMLVDQPIQTQAPFVEEKMARGGQMIKRADGSYSRRGLWDNIRANRGSGKKPTKQMLEQERKIKAAEKAYGGYYAEGGSFDNPGFRALPEYVQAKIKSNMEVGGYMDYDDTMEYGKGGYTVRRSNDRKGKTHVVTGPDGTKKYFGDPKLGERGKSKYGKKAFYARHKKNLAKNPYFRAYARATWEDGGYMDMEPAMYNYGGPMMYAQGGIHIDPSKRGTFKAQASKMGMGVQEAASTILNAPEGKYSPAMRKKANFARNFAKEDGGYYQMGGDMMQPQQMPQQGGGQEEAAQQIIQQVAQMLQQNVAPEQVVGKLIEMGVPQQQAVQIVEMVAQQMQGQQQPAMQQQMPPQAQPPGMMRYGGRVIKQMGDKLFPQQNQGNLVPENMYSTEKVSTPDDYDRIYDIVGNTLDRETRLGYSNYGFTQPGATQYANTEEGRNQAINAGINQYFNKYGLYEMPDSQQAMAFDFAFNSEDPRASMMVAAGKLTPAQKLQMYSQGKLDPAKVDEAWGKYGADVMAMGDALNDPFAAEKIRSYRNTTGANTNLPEWTKRVNEVKAFAPQYFSKNSNQSSSLMQPIKIPTSQPIKIPTSLDYTVKGPSLEEFKALSFEKPQKRKPTLKGPKDYKSPMDTYIAGAAGSMVGPLSNIAAAAFAPDPTYTAAPKLQRYDYTPVALQQAAGNQALANTREGFRRGAPTQGSYLSNMAVASPSMAMNLGEALAKTRYGIDTSNIGIANQEAQLAAAQAEKNALLKDQSIANRWQLGMKGAEGIGSNVQGFSKDMGAKRMQDMIVNSMKTGDFSIIGYDVVNGQLIPKLAPSGLATYENIIETDDGRRYKKNPDGTYTEIK